MAIDNDRAVPGPDQLAGDERLRDGLPGPGRPDDEGVAAAAVSDGDADGAPAMVAADRKAPAVDPPSTAHVAALHALAASVQQRATVPGVLGAVGAVADVVEVPP